jgi:alpha-tubulin suppressor-like RCC1 family protein
MKNQLQFRSDSWCSGARGIQMLRAAPAIALACLSSQLNIATASAGPTQDIMWLGRPWSTNVDTRAFQQRFVHVAAGPYHTAGLTADGKVWTWGRNRGKPGTTGYNGEALGWGERTRILRAAVLSDTVVGVYGTWGGTTIPGHPSAVPTGTIALEVGVSWGGGESWRPTHVSFLLSDGTVVCWAVPNNYGGNVYGEATVPPGLTNVRSIATVGTGSLALRSNGTLAYWGSTIWTPPSFTEPIRSISGNLECFAAVKTNGNVVAWGTTRVPQSTVPSALGSVREVAMGYYHAAAIRTDGSVTCWGRADEGQCTVPTDLGPVSEVACGGWQTVALCSDGSARCWGNNGDAECGIPRRAAQIVQVVESRAYHSGSKVIRWSDGVVTALEHAPSPPSDMRPVSLLAAGGDHFVALQDDATVRCWGLNNFGQCTPPSDLTGVRSVAAGYRFSAAVRIDGTVVCWGSNSDGQCTVPTTLPPTATVACGDSHCAALGSDGSVTCWGRNVEIQCGVPIFYQPAVQVVCGVNHTAARFADGKVSAWGDPAHHNAPVPFYLGPVTAIAAGGYRTLALRPDGSAVFWGDAGFYTDVPTSYPHPDCQQVTAIDAGFDTDFFTIESTALPPSCPEDLQRDGVVDGGDLGIQLSQWGHHEQIVVGDINSDGTVDGQDIAQILAAWGTCSGN